MGCDFAISAIVDRDSSVFLSQFFGTSRTSPKCVKTAAFRGCIYGLRLRYQRYRAPRF
jgi:hypothetical protein